MDAVTLWRPRWDGGEGGEGMRARIISAEFRKCETAETKCQSWELRTDGGACTWWCACFVEVRRVWMSGGGGVFLPHASDKSHLSGRSPYETWDTTVATPHICCCFLCLGTLPSWSYKAVIRTIKLTPSPLAWPPWRYRSEISLYMPDFLCLTVLLLAYNGGIVCSRYGATKSVTARIDTVIKQDSLWAAAPWFTCHAGTIYLFPRSFHQCIITIHFELFHAPPKKWLNHSVLNVEVLFHSFIYNLWFFLKKHELCSVEKLLSYFILSFVTQNE